MTFDYIRHPKDLPALCGRQIKESLSVKIFILVLRGLGGGTSSILKELVHCFMGFWQHSFTLKIKKSYIHRAANIFEG